MANEKQLTYWNDVAGPKWVKIGDAMEARFAAISDLLLARVAVQAGERVLDIGCGTGTTARPFAAAGGVVTGMDISSTMLDVARTRGGGVEYLEADAQVFDFGETRFEVLASRFGVMFFADPVAAFINLHGAMAPGGRLCFICWAPLQDNPHWAIPFEIIAARLGAPEPRHPLAPGPLAFSDAAYVESLLRAAGFSSIAVTPTTVDVIGTSLEEELLVACTLGPAGALLDEKAADAATRAALRAEIASPLARFVTADGLNLPAMVFVVTALA